MKYPLQNWQDAFCLIGSLVGLIWCIAVLNHFVAFTFNQYGILPRDSLGLIGIFFWVLLHGDFMHVMVNTAPLLFLGFFVGLRGAGLFFKVTSIIWFTAGLLVWLIGRDAIHIGASGLVFGYFGFLLAVAIYERNLFDLCVASLVLFYYGGMFFGVFPVEAPVSWEAHLAGLFTGVLTAKWLGREWVRR